MPTALTTLRNVEIAHVGTFMPNSTTGKPWVVTEADIASAVEASRNPSFRAPVAKLGHKDPRFTKGDDPIFLRDGNPGVGRLVNQRASEDGQRLIADVEGMPTWLAEVLPSAYPSRSVDAMLHASDGKGNNYSLVITHLAFLGETTPAIESLADVAALYGHHDTDVTEWVAAAHVAATFQGDPMPETVSAARVENVMAAAEAAAGDGRWCREILRDKVVYVNAQGMVWTAEWSEKDGVINIGTPAPAAVSYTPLAASAAGSAAHALHQPLSFRVASAAGLGSPSGRSLGETSVSIAPAVREALGLDESATEDAVNAAILEKLTAPVAVPTPIVQEPVAVTPPAPIVDTTPVIPVIPAVQDSRSDSDSGRSNSSNLEQQVAAAVSAALPAAVQAQVSAQVAPLAASNETLRTELTRVSAELADTKQAKALQVRDDVIGGAISAGKIRSSDRERFTALYEASPQVVVDLFSHLSVGSAVPISAAGYAGDDTQATDEFKSFEASFGWEAASNG